MNLRQVESSELQLKKKKNLESLKNNIKTIFSKLKKKKKKGIKRNSIF
jgi:hypothetical protein